jgi:signal peptidase I
VAAAALPAPRSGALRLRWALALAAPVLAALAIRALAFEPFEVASDSMLPTLEAGDRLFVNKLAVPRRGDVVVFEHAGERYVKRVVGLAGERVELRAGRVLVNGVAADEWRTGTLRVDARGRALSGVREQLGAVEHALLDDPERQRAGCAAVVPADHFFVLGDNRDHSADSRDFGSIPRAEIVGVVASWLGNGPRFEQERPDAE